MKIPARTAILLGFTLAILTSGPGASAQGSMTGVRAMGMADAFTAAATGSGALFHNPAGVSALMMYSVEASYLYDQQTGLSSLHASIVDGKSNQSLGGGIGYTYSVSSSRASLPSFSGHDVYGALSMPVIPGWLIAGVAIHYLDYAQADQDIADGITLDTGIMVSLGRFLAIGAAVKNLVEVENSGQGLDAGFGLNLHTTFFQLATDTIVHFDCEEDACLDFRVGAEYLAPFKIPIRIGYQYQTHPSSQQISAGAGWRHDLFGLDLLFRQDIEQGDNRMLGMAINLYL
ncbi:MAG: hypothetical protein JW797_19415 [Bradymonadales bacterium]|nr:hypothetical protein [Bradymonadales bacterium]